MPISVWITVLVALAAALFLQNLTRYTTSDRFSDLLSDIAFYIIFVFLVVFAAFTYRNYLRSGDPLWHYGRAILWFVSAFGLWWILFNGDSRTPPRR